MTGPTKNPPRPEWLVRLEKTPDFRRLRREIKKVFRSSPAGPLGEMVDVAKVILLLKAIGVPLATVNRTTFPMVLSGIFRFLSPLSKLPPSGPAGDYQTPEGVTGQGRKRSGSPASASIPRTPKRRSRQKDPA